MKLERLHEHLTTATAVIIGGLVSYWFGLLAGEGSVGTIIAIIAGFCLTGLLLGLRRNVWILIPLSWPLGGALPQMKYHPALHDVVIGSVLLATFMLMAVKIVRYKPKFSAIDFWVWATLLYLLVTWVRHPTGGLVLNSDRIGGRAYINTIIAYGAYFVLARSWVPRNWDVRKLTLIYLACNVLPGFLNALAAVAPGVAGRVSAYYGGISDPFAVVDPSPDPMAQSTDRKTYMQELAFPVVQWMLAVYRPLTVLNPLFLVRSAFFAACVLATLMAGFRSILLTIVGLIVVGSYLRRGLMEAMRVGFLVVGAAALLALSSYFVHLPLSIQRALTILPGRWDEFAVAEANHSTQWRIYMWREMMTTNRYIENKWLGDGFGFTRQQFELMTTTAGLGQAQENFLIVGEVHSGPISAIRYVGYLGSLLYYALLFTMAREALALCRLTMNKELGPLTWILCMPLIFEPFRYVVIFGSYDSSMPLQIFGAGLLKMLRRTVEVWGEETAPEILPALPARPRPRPQRPALPVGGLRPITVPLP